VPSLGRFVNRRPTYDLSFVERIPGAFPEVPEEEEEEEEEEERPEPTEAAVSRPPSALGRAYSITSEITPSHYAVLPSGASLEGWTQEEVDQLNDYVRHMLHSRRSRLKRSLSAFGKYVRRPLGFAVTLYATLITLFGLAWVLFLIGWIYVGEKQLYAINVIDNVLVALFAIVGDGMAPFRAVDTYHLIWIVHYCELLLGLLPAVTHYILQRETDTCRHDRPPDMEATQTTFPTQAREQERPAHELAGPGRAVRGPTRPGSGPSEGDVGEAGVLGVVAQAAG